MVPAANIMNSYGYILNSIIREILSILDKKLAVGCIISHTKFVWKLKNCIEFGLLQYFWQPKVPVTGGELKLTVTSFEIVSGIVMRGVPFEVASLVSDTPAENGHA